MGCHFTPGRLSGPIACFSTAEEVLLSVVLKVPDMLNWIENRNSGRPGKEPYTICI